MKEIISVYLRSIERGSAGLPIKQFPLMRDNDLLSI